MLVVVTGVGSDDLPFLSPNNGIAKNFSRFSVVRKLDWRVDTTGNPMRRELKDRISVVAAFGQTRGEEASRPCSFCRTDKGPGSLALSSRTLSTQARNTTVIAPTVGTVDAILVVYVSHLSCVAYHTVPYYAFY